MMATSLRDLLHTLERETQWRITTETQYRDARLALTQLARALRQLTDDGLERDGAGPRTTIARQLADACTAHTDPNHPAKPGRLTTLAGAVADTVAVIRDETGREQRWATCVAIAGTVQVLTSYAADGDGHRTADLVWTHGTARALTQQGRLEQDVPGSHIALDRPIPQQVLPADAGPTRAALEAFLHVSHRLRRSTAGLADPPTLLEIFAVTRAAESTIRHAALIIGQPDAHENQPPAAATVWRDIRNQLRPFTNTAVARTGEEDLTHSARRVHQALTQQHHATRRTAAGRHDHDVGVRVCLTAMTLEVAPIAGLLATSLDQLADHGDLHALAKRLPYRDRHLTEHLSNRAVIADRHDLDAIRDRLEQAARLARETVETLTHPNPTVPEVPRRHVESQMAALTPDCVVAPIGDEQPRPQDAVESRTDSDPADDRMTVPDYCDLRHAETNGGGELEFEFE